MSNDKIECKLDGAMVHSVELHLRNNHPEVSIADYMAQYPGAPILSELAKQTIAKKKAEAAAAAPAATQPAPTTEGTTTVAETKGIEISTVAAGEPVKMNFHEVFNLGMVKEALSLKGSPIPINVLTKHAKQDQDMVPEKSDEYIYDIDELKNCILALEKRIPLYVWGHKGSGKSDLIEQMCARLNRPFMRVQHSANTEESHIVGQWVVRNGSTEFELGPLPVAMMRGWVFCADEYDFALPSVLAVYQAVLEGKPLIIKEADAANRIIKPHENFRFVATGNTNGSGDETGLYQGTNLQNSANYDRFGMVVNKQYLSKKNESQILQKKVGLVPADADKMAEFAALVRESYDGGKISDTISPRTLIYAATIGIARGNFHQGLQCSFINKLTAVDRETCSGLAQRIFG